MWDTCGKLWKDLGVRIICISVDNAKDKLITHVNSKKWNNGLEHFQIQSPGVMKQFGINGVPHVMLVDKEGHIVFKGHPSMRQDLEGDIMKLAKGEKLS